jgi:alanyl-tRNA synthetase
MSKLETALGSSASAPSQLIKQIRELQGQMEQSRLEIEKLPPAIAEQVSQALSPLEGLSLTEIERLAQIQRTTLDAMASELTKQATKSFETSTRQLLTTINQTSQQLKEATANLEAAATLPEVAQQMEQQARAMRPRWWKGPTLAAGSALTSALVVVALIGLFDSKQLALLSADDPRLQHLIERTTEAEYELIREIYSRPAP